MSQQPLVSLQDLAVHFSVGGAWLQSHARRVRAVDGVMLEVRRNEVMALVGESGSGKTTTGRAVLRLVEPTAGRVIFDGTDIAALDERSLRRLRRRMQMIFQNPFTSLDPRTSIGASIGEPLRVHTSVSRSERAERVRSLLTLVGLDPNHMNRLPHEFSGGQRQRIGIARAVALEPQLIVCDEPTSALDVSVQAQILNLLVSLRERLQLTYIFISHNLSAVRQVSDRVAVMYLGRIVEIGPTEAIFQRALHPYTRALLSAAPIPDPKRERARRHILLRGDMPSPAAPPAGCRFHTRCWLYQAKGSPEICRTLDPTLDSVADHASACHFSGEDAP